MPGLTRPTHAQCSSEEPSNCIQDHSRLQRETRREGRRARESRFYSSVQSDGEREMAGMRDPLTDEPPPSRFDPEELNSFEPTDDIDLTPPTVEWAPSVVEKLQSGKLRPQLLIVALSKVGINLIHNLSKKTVIGNILLPGTSMPKAISEPSPKDRVCYLYSCELDLAVILVSVQYMVPVESSSVWTKFLFNIFHAERVLVIEHTPIRHFRGKLSVDEPMLFVLNTDQQMLEDKQLEPIAPYYPSGSLVDGLAAALLTHCQMRGLKGRLLLTWPEEDSGLVNMLVARLCNLLKVLPQGANVNFAEAGKKFTAKKPLRRHDLYI